MAFTVEQQDLIWSSWRAGESIRLIGRRLGCAFVAVRRYLLTHGGVRPAPLSRNPRHLSVGEREEISRGVAAGLSSRQIAVSLGRSASSVSREIARNGGRGAYRAVDADLAATRRAKRPRRARLRRDPALLAAVRGKLEEDWSPEQIAVWLTRTYPSDTSMRLSHEAMYRSIYVARHRGLGLSAARHLRSGRTMRKPRMVAPATGRGRLRNMGSIHGRPAEVDERTQVGHWEGDLVMGVRPSAMATLVERKTRYLKIVRLPEGYRSGAVRAGLSAGIEQIPAELRRLLTWDRGREMAEHQQLAADLDLRVYFCDPRSPRQRGSNENTNRLLRQYLAKGADLRTFSQADLDAIAHRINARPRRVLGWATAHDQFTAQACT